jgi:hypothetical protein
MKTPAIRPVLLLALLALTACKGARPHPQVALPATPEPVRNEAVFAGDLHGHALLFDLRRSDLDGGAAGAIDIDRPRAAHVLTLEIDADGPFMLEARGAQGARFRHAADGADRLTLPARRGRLEIAVSPRGEGLTRIRALVRYGEDLPPQGDPPPPRAHPIPRVDAEPLPPPSAETRHSLPEGVRTPNRAESRP